MMDWAVLTPLAPLLAAALVLLVAARWLGRDVDRAVPWLAGAALGSSLLLVLLLSSRRAEAFGGILVWDALAAGASGVVLAGALAAVLLLPAHAERRGLHSADFTLLLLLAAMGLVVMSCAREWLTAALALESASLCLYALAGYDARRASSAEAALKYFLPGAVATGLLLYGAACHYGATGSTRIGAGSLSGPLGTLAAGLLLAALAFKAGLVPFHSWVPDVYAGAPSPATAFLAASVKAAAFALMARFAMLSLPGLPAGTSLLVLAALATMTFANLAGLAQTGLKRLLAYSAVAHSGYLLVGLAGIRRQDPVGPLLFYLASYALLTVGAFAAASALEDPATGGLEISRMRGLGRRRPVMSLMLAACLLGLAGFPPTAGFVAKVMLFSAAWARGLEVLVVAAVLNSVVALAYYLKPILAMFLQPAPEGAEHVDPPCWTAASVLAFLGGAGGLLLGLFGDL